VVFLNRFANDVIELGLCIIVGTFPEENRHTSLYLNNILLNFNARNKSKTQNQSQFK